MIDSKYLTQIMH